MPHIPDTYSARGADRLKATIVNYWLAQGYTSVRVERYQVWEGTWGIRSNLVNGLPPEGRARGKYMPQKRVLTPRVQQGEAA